MYRFNGHGCVELAFFHVFFQHFQILQNGVLVGFVFPLGGIISGKTYVYVRKELILAAGSEGEIKFYAAVVNLSNFKFEENSHVCKRWLKSNVFDKIFNQTELFVLFRDSEQLGLLLQELFSNKDHRFLESITIKGATDKEDTGPASDVYFHHLNGCLVNIKFSNIRLLFDKEMSTDVKLLCNTVVFEYCEIRNTEDSIMGEFGIWETREAWMDALSKLEIVIMYKCNIMPKFCGFIAKPKYIWLYKVAYMYKNADFAWLDGHITETAFGNYNFFCTDLDWKYFAGKALIFRNVWTVANHTKFKYMSHFSQQLEYDSFIKLWTIPSVKLFQVLATKDRHLTLVRGNKREQKPLPIIQLWTSNKVSKFIQKGEKDVFTTVPIAMASETQISPSKYNFLKMPLKNFYDMFVYRDVEFHRNSQAFTTLISKKYEHVPFDNITLSKVLDTVLDIEIKWKICLYTSQLLEGNPPF